MSAGTACRRAARRTTFSAALSTLTNGVAGPLHEVAGGGQWLNGISCWSATQCDAIGLVNDVPSFVPISSGTPQAAIAIPGGWYANGIDCTAVGAGAG